MGSPLFGQIELTGFDLGSREFGKSMAFSSDSRYFSANQLTSSVNGPSYAICIFDLVTRREILIHAGSGLIRKLSWDGHEINILEWTASRRERKMAFSITPDLFPTPEGKLSFLQRLFNKKG